MILSILLQDHDHEPKIIYVDSEKLNPTNPVDYAIIKALKQGQSSAFIQAQGWDYPDSPFHGHEPELSRECRVKAPINKFRLVIDYGG